jgi:hypothetical protein
MKPLTNQRRQTPAASSAQSLHRASLPHAEIGEKICNRRVINFSAARNYFQRRRLYAPRVGGRPLDADARRQTSLQAAGKYPRNLIHQIFLSFIFLFSRGGSQKMRR